MPRHRPRRHHSHVLSIALSLASSAALVSACGPSTPPPTIPETSGSDGDGATDGDGDGAATGGDAKGPAPAVAPTESVPIGTTSLLADFEKLGVDMKKPPTLDKIKLGTKKKIMPFFQKSLGMDSCEGCHAEGDYKKDTRMVQIARNMWNTYVVELRDAKGGPLLCDACHQGKQKLLAREDKEALSKFMEENYEQKLTMASGDSHGCTTCHGSDLEMKIFEKMWNVK